MFNDLLQSKNAPAALILIAAGALLAVALPALTDFPGWAAGSIGLSIGAVAGVIALQGRGANRDELLGLRTAVKAAQRGERAARSASLSPELKEVFAAIDDVAGEVEARQSKLRESEQASERLRAELDQRDEQLAHAREELARSIDGLAQLLGEQHSCADRLDSSARQTQTVLDSAGDDLEQLIGRADASASGLLSLSNDSQEAVAEFGALVLGARDALGPIDALAQELRAWEQAARALQLLVESAAAGQRDSDHASRASEQTALEWERCLELALRAQTELGRCQAASAEAGAVIAGVRSPLGTLGLSLEAIEDLTEQMSLLALNAAIVAAQAGEHGRGFGVIADGMKDLADRAQLTSKQLAALIGALSDQTQLALQASERHAAGLERSSGAAEESVHALRRSLEAAQRAALTSVPPARDGDGYERALGAAQQLTSAIAERARELAQLVGPADQLRRGAQQLERRQHEQAGRVRQLASGSESVARALEQLGKAQRSQARALEEAVPAVEQLRELQREHERRLSSLLALTHGLQRSSSSGREGA